MDPAQTAEALPARDDADELTVTRALHRVLSAALRPVGWAVHLDRNAQSSDAGDIVLRPARGSRRTFRVAVSADEDTDPAGQRLPAFALPGRSVPPSLPATASVAAGRPGR